MATFKAVEHRLAANTGPWTMMAAYEPVL